MPLIQPVPQVDIGRLIAQGLGAYGQVQGIQQRSQQAEDQRNQAAMRAQRSELMSRAASDPEAFRTLSGLDPAAAGEIEKLRAFQDERFRRERAMTAGQIENLPVGQQISTLDQRLKMLNERGSDPSNTQGLRDLLASGDPAKMQQGQQAIFNARVQGEREGFLKPAPTPEKGTTLARNLELLNDPRTSKRDKEIILASLMGSQQRIEVNADGSTTITSGKGLKSDGVSKKTKGALEQKLIYAEETISNLGRIKQQFNKDFLTYKGRGKAFISGIKSKAGIGLRQKDFLKKRRQFTQNVNQFFNEYRRIITGAAAAVQELEALKKASLSEDLSPDEFEAAFNEFESSTLRMQRLTRKLYREGVAGSLKNKKSPAARELNRQYLGGGDDSPLDRIQELQTSGKSENEIFETLKTEGYKL